LKTIRLSAIILFTFLNILSLTFSQDSLSVDVLQSISYSFQINQEKLSGEGATYLLNKLSKAQFTLLGEYHGSKNISEFTEALIPQLHEWDYRHFVLEVGPNTGQFLDQLPSNKNKVVSNLTKLNQKYLSGEEEDVRYPIPFFDKIEDARFLGEAKERDWKIIGIDQEYVNGYSLQFDWMYNNLDSKKKDFLSEKHSAVQDTLTRMSIERDTKNIPLYSAIVKSEFIQDYLSQMSRDAKNIQLVEAFRKSIEIYHMNTIGKWYQNNSTRVKYMKERLRLGLEESDFDISKDKLLIKMGGYHMSQGFSPLGFYEVGNTLNEIAEYHRNYAVNIGFINRFEMNDNKLEDALDIESRYVENLKSFYGMGTQNEWIIIDLESLREGYYYHPQKYLLNKYEEKLIQQFDVLIVTPTEYPAKNNF